MKLKDLIPSSLTYVGSSFGKYSGSYSTYKNVDGVEFQASYDKWSDYFHMLAWHPEKKIWYANISIDFVSNDLEKNKQKIENYTLTLKPWKK